MAKKKAAKSTSTRKPKNPAKKKARARDESKVVVGTRSESDGNTQSPDIAIVGVGASAGGLDAFRKFLEPMPADCGMAFVLVQHLDPTHSSHTAELLRSHTQLSVVEASDGLPVEPNRVYVIPPGAYLSISGEELRLSEPIARRGVRVPIDFFFRSLAEDQQQRAICVILSGTGSDGTLGLREVKAAGGMVLAQDPSTSQFDGMPRSAIATGLVDHILPPDQMADVLSRYIRHWYLNGETPPAAQATDDFNAILAILRTRNKFDFSCYKKGTLSRRVQRRMGLRHVETLADYANLLRAEPAETAALFKDLLIGVTNFFRQPDAWQKEELQSLNEELTTVNSQLEAKMGELQATNNDLHNLLSSTGIAMVFLDRQFRIKRFTPAATGLMRLIPSDIGRPLSDIVLNFDDPDLPADVETVLARLTQVEKEIQTGDGAWYTRRVLPYRTEDNLIGGVVVTLADITDRKRADEATQQLNVALRQQVEERTTQLTQSNQDLQAAVANREETRIRLRKGEEKFGAMFYLAAVGIAQIDAAGRFVHVNPKFCEMLGYTHDELLGRSFLDVTHQADRDADAASLSQLVSIACDAPVEGEANFAPLSESETDSAYDKALQAAPPIEKRYLRKDGSPLWAVVRTALICEESGRPTTAIRVAVDLSARRELEARLAEITEQERQRLGREMHDTLSQQITAIGLKAAKLHEQLVRESSPLDSQAEALLDMIDDAQGQVRALLKGMLPVEFDGGGLRTALSDLADRTRSLHEIDCRSEVDISAPIDNSAAIQLYRIAQEAVHNAAKHSGARHIVIGLHDGADIMLEIRDDGLGLANTVGESRGKPTTTTHSGGAGLQIMRYRAHLIGGQLSIRSAKPHGTIVQCSLPISLN